MKYKKIILNLILATFLLNSCNDDFLERYPLDQISDATFWNTENDLEIYNNGIYETSKTNDQINIGHRGNTYTKMTRDIWGETFATSDYFSAHVNRRSGKNPVPSSAQQGGWKGWNLLRKINVGLANYHKADIPQATINKYAAEARFFRAWFFSDKVQLFGDVPWVGKPMNIDSEELFAARMPREQAMDSVLADINFAVDNLPESWPGAGSPSTTGRFNKWHALLLKSNIALFEGTWRKYHGGSNPNFWLEEAANAAKELIDNGPYEIYSTGNPHSDYREMFANPTTFDLSGNPEVMYWREYRQDATTHMMQTYWHHQAGATKSFVDDYLMIDGNPVITTEGVSPLYMDDKTIEDVFENRDNRMRQTLLHPEDAEKYRFYEHMPVHPLILGMGGTKETVTGYHCIKYWNRDMMNLTWGQITQPAVIMRYARALLNYAEAKAELGTLTQADLDITINVLRDRVDMPHLDLDNVPVDPRYTDVSPIIAEVRRERKIELAMEGLRLKDIYRWKWGHLMREPDMGIRWDQEAIDRYQNATVRSSEITDPITGEVRPYIDVYKGTGYENPIFEDNKHYHWPLPLNVLTENPEFKQNPGWEF